jgi:radical SAM superfamily enzyme YgiQ (UPF0313 family)
MTDIVLTADRTLMTDYNGLALLGHVACFPDRLIPNTVLTQLLPRLRNGEATYALRRVEAKLIDEGYDVTIILPQEIKKLKKLKPKIVGISTVDPLSRKPHPWTLTNLFGGGEAVTQSEFFKLLNKINDYKKKQIFNIFIGGPGASEFAKVKEYDELFDSAIIGSVENATDVFDKALQNEHIPKRTFPISPDFDDLSIIKGPARCGHVQVTQGCPRGCKFCGPTLMKWRSFPISRILKEIEVNLSYGVKQVSLISEDLFLYGSKEVEVNHRALINLFDSILKIKDYEITRINTSDVSFAAVKKGKKTCEQISDMLGLSKECPMDTIIGLETGSERLMKEHMDGKAKPYSLDKWHELVKEGTNILNDNYWYPVLSLITGLPDENEEDVIKTLDLIDELDQNKLFYYIFYFVPMEGTELGKFDFFYNDDLNDRRWELFYRCWMKSIKSLKTDLDMFVTDRVVKFLLRRILHETEKDLIKYRNDPFIMKDNFASVNLKGIHLFSFLARRFISN